MEDPNVKKISKKLLHILDKVKVSHDQDPSGSIIKEFGGTGSSY
jgi:hypothetical protein